MNLTRQVKDNHYLIILYANACLVFIKLFLSDTKQSQITGVSWQTPADDRGLVWNCTGGAL